MAKIMDPILPLLSILGYWAILLGALLEVQVHIHAGKPEQEGHGTPDHRIQNSQTGLVAAGASRLNRRGAPPNV